MKEMPYKYTIALFGEAQKGKFQTPYYCDSLIKLSECLGAIPDEGGRGLDFAVRSLLFNLPVIYFRVQEEGFSLEDYYSGLALLKKKESFPKVSALCLPGVGDQEIIKVSDSICMIHKSFLIISESDFYDFITT